MATKTTTKKRITVKQIQSVLRGMNPTEIFRLYVKIYGDKVDYDEIMRLIQENALFVSSQKESILRDMKPTEIFRLYVKAYGGRVERHKVMQFIQKYAPSQKVSKNARNIAYAMNTKKPVPTDQIQKSYAWKEVNAKHLAIEALKENIKTWRKYPAEAKRPMMDYTHLWFCSPYYGLDDYNRWRAMPIKGNERFCETICKLADKYFV